MRSMSDLLSSSQNIATALNGINSTLLGLYYNLPTVPLCEASLGTSAAILYTASGQAKSHVNVINICNTTGASINVYAFVVPAGGAPGTSNAIFYNAQIPAYTTMLWEGFLIIPANGTLQGYASAAGCTILASGGSNI